MNIAEVSVRNPVTTLMMFLGVILVGAFCFLQMPLDLLPEMDIPMITVSTPYEGVGPEEIEEKVTRPLEKNLATVEDLKHIYSTSREGRSNIRLQFNWGTDLESRANDVRDAVDQTMGDLPDDVERPGIYKLDITQFPVLVYGVLADDSYPDLEDILEDEVADLLEGVEGVASVDVIVPLRRQVNVDLDRERLAAHELTPLDVAAVVARENYQTSGGSIKMGDTDYLPRVPGEFKSVEPMNGIVVQARNGSIVRLLDVGQATFGFKDLDMAVRINGRHGGLLFVQKQSDANTVSTVRGVQRRLERIQASGRLPQDITFIAVMDGSDDILRMVRDLVDTLWMGGLLAMLAVLIFLRQWRGTVIIALTIPFSLIAAGIAMYLMDYSINMLTLFALIIAIGMVVDNAIVILENITSHREEGESTIESAIYGASEVAMAVAASTLTTLCIFFPLMFVEGMSRILFTPFAIVCSVVLAASLFTALTMTPMLASKWLTSRYEERHRENRLFNVSEKVFNRLLDNYARLLEWSLRHRKIVLGAVTLLLLCSLVLVPFIGFELMPEEDRGSVRGTIELPVGTRYERTSEALEAVYEEIVKEVPAEQIRAVFLRAGGGSTPTGGKAGSHIGSFGMRLVPREERDRHVSDIGDGVRRRVERLMLRHGIESLDVDLGSAMSGLIVGGSGLSVEILGDDMDAADQLAEELLARMKAIPGAVDLSLSRQDVAPEAWVNVDRDKASALGLNVSDVADAVRLCVYGDTVSYYRVEGDEYDIVVRLREADRRLVDDLGTIPLRVPGGDLIRVENIGEVVRTTGPLEIERKDQRRVVRVEGKVYGRSLGEVAADAEAIVAQMEVPEGIEVVVGGQIEEMRETFLWLTIALVIAVLLVYMVMAAQFESLLHPFVVMFSIPFAFIGVIWVLFLGGYTLSMVVFLGALLLVGVVVNNAIVLVDYTNILRARGFTMEEAIREAGRARLRPVLMTAITTIVGLWPMAFKQGQGAEIWNPLGLTILSGLLVSTLVTLVLVPVMYSILESRIRL